MSIIIQNIGGNPLGVCKYQLRINQDVVAEFEHNRVDGLATCLRAAAEAVEKDKWMKARDEILAHYFGENG